jgi:hypothetical protein
LQSRDLTVQRHILQEAQTLQRRSFDVEVRKLHVHLMQMAIEHPHLATVWPNLGITDPATLSQHMYANLIIQHVHLQYTTGIATRDELISNLRSLFASPNIRAFWRDTASTRRSIYVEGTTELDLAALIDDIWREYESVLNCSAGSRFVGADGVDWVRESLRTDSGNSASAPDA